MTDELSRLARIETKLDDLSDWVKAEARLREAMAKDITGLKVDQAKWFGGATVAGAVLGWLADKLFWR